MLTTLLTGVSACANARCASVLSPACGGGRTHDLEPTVTPLWRLTWAGAHRTSSPSFWQCSSPARSSAARPARLRPHRPLVRSWWRGRADPPEAWLGSPSTWPRRRRPGSTERPRQTARCSSWTPQATKRCTRSVPRKGYRHQTMSWSPQMETSITPIPFQGSSAGSCWARAHRRPPSWCRSTTPSPVSFPSRTRSRSPTMRHISTWGVVSPRRRFRT